MPHNPNNNKDALFDTVHADPLAASSEPPELDDWLTPADTTGPRPLDASQRQLAEAHVQVAYRLAWRFARHHFRDMPADELIAEAMFALTHAAGLYDTSRDVPFEMYAGLLIRHRLLYTGRLWRRHERHFRMKMELIADEPYVPVEALIEEPQPDLLCNQIRDILPKRWYDVLWLHCTEGMTLEEIGARLGVSKQRAQKIINKAMQRARVKIDGWGSVC